MANTNSGFEYRAVIMNDTPEPEHYLWDHELFFVLNGDIKIKIGAESCTFTQDDVLLISANQRCEFMPGNNALIFRLTIPRELLKCYMPGQKPVFWCNSRLDSHGDYDTLRFVLRQLLNAKYQHPNAPSLMATSYYYELLDLLVSQFIVSPDTQFGSRDEQNPDRINEITEYIEDNYGSNISLNDLADHLHLTYSYVSHYLKKTMGVSFLNYLNQVRLRHAVGDLLYTDKSVTQIALDNGFGNSSRFNTAFREVYETTPTSYQLAMRNGAESGQEDVIRQEKVLRQVRRYLTEYGVESGRVSAARRDFIRVDGAHSEAFARHWEETVNLGRVSDLLKTRVQEQTLYLRDQLGFRYVRIWGVFDEDMELGIGHDAGALNFFKMDEALDFLTRNNLIPFIELGNKPTIIIRDLHDFLMVREGYPIYQNLSELRPALERLFFHFVARYGANNVRNWRFECWEDDRIDPGSGFPGYFEVFNTVCEAARTVLPDAVIGGNGIIINHADIENCLNAWMNQPFKPDFFSVHCYPYEESADPNLYTSYTHLSTDSAFLIHRLEELKNRMLMAGMDCPVYVSEWNITASSRNYLNDSCYKACYLLKNIIGSLGSCSVLGCWAGLDLIHTYYDSSSVICGCPGLITNDAICKPSFYAYRFLHLMGQNLVDAGENYLVTSGGNFNFDIICFNQHTLDSGYYKVPEAEHTPESLQTFVKHIAPVRLRFRLDNLPETSYTIKTSVVSPQYGSVLDEWLRLNTMTNMLREDMEYLRRICTPHLMVQSRESTDGHLIFDVDLAAQEFALIQIYHAG